MDNRAHRIAARADRARAARRHLRADILHTLALEAHTIADTGPARVLYPRAAESG